MLVERTPESEAQNTLQRMSISSLVDPPNESAQIDELESRIGQGNDVEPMWEKQDNVKRENGRNRPRLRSQKGVRTGLLKRKENGTFWSSDKHNFPECTPILEKFATKFHQFLRIFRTAKTSCSQKVPEWQKRDREWSRNSKGTQEETLDYLLFQRG